SSLAPVACRLRAASPSRPRNLPRCVLPPPPGPATYSVPCFSATGSGRSPGSHASGAPHRALEPLARKLALPALLSRAASAGCRAAPRGREDGDVDTRTAWSNVGGMATIRVRNAPFQPWTRSGARRGAANRRAGPGLLPFLAAFLLLAGCARQAPPGDPAPAPAPETWRVVSYNIHHGAGLDGRIDLE